MDRRGRPFETGSGTPHKRNTEAGEEGRIRFRAGRVSAQFTELQKPRVKTFIGIDGEGLTREGSHEYVLLGTSKGTSIENLLGLKSAECFEFLLDTSQANPGATFVGFYTSYDVNMILKTFRPESLAWLAESGWTKVRRYDDTMREYYVEYIPRKRFSIRESTIEKDAKTLRSFTWYDVFGFFQSGFASAIESFGIGTESERKLICEMKANRADFDTIDIDQIRGYNMLECRLLVELMNYLETCLIGVGIDLKRYHGAGAIASYLFAEHHTKDVLEREEEVEGIALNAYYGGRIQTFQIGEIDGTVQNYDINSAYPAAFTRVPSLVNVGVKPLAELTANLASVYKVSWACPPDSPITPFPFRNDDGTICYPYQGAGFYWQPEVEAALQCFGSQIAVEYGFELVPESAEQPFGWIAELYTKRQELKASGNPSEYALKLGLNSLYGKTAQRSGWRKTAPPYQSYVWAGMITSFTRASLLRAVMQMPSDIISINTDGIVSRSKLRLPLEKALGDWSVSSYTNLFVLKPGFYTGVLPDGSVYSRVRGTRLGAIDFSEIRKIWLDKGVAGCYTYPDRQFISMSAASENRPHCTWQESEREVTFWPS